MKKTASFILLISFTTINLFSQKQSKQQEAGISFSSLNSFGLVYRTGSKSSLWRYNAILLRGKIGNSSFDTTRSESTSIGLGLSFGKEWRKTITKELDFRIGADIFIRGSYDSQDQNNDFYNNGSRKDQIWAIEPGMNMVVGLNYTLKEKLVFGAEFKPFVSYSYSQREFEDNNTTPNKVSQESNSVNFGMSNSGIQLTMLYRF